tara:strand:+ start:365 stop:757 length:393 start_codon:yes stop_codon:yes gene_type:complete
MSKQYFDKLNTEKLTQLNKKVELERVEFNVLNEITNAYLKADKLVTNANKLADKIEKAFGNYTNEQEKGVQLQKQLEEAKKLNERLTKEANKAAKDFGIDPNSLTEIKKIKEMDALLERTVNLLDYPSIR